MDNKYKLQYLDGDYTVCIEFPTEQSLDELRSKLKYFLSACSWLPSQVDELLGADI